MKKCGIDGSCFDKEINCAIIIKKFHIFQQFMDRKVGIVLIPFFHVLFVRFIKQLKYYSGNSHEITDYFDYECVVDYDSFKHKEDNYVFVLKEKIVRIQTQYRSMDDRFVFSVAFQLVRGFSLSSNSSYAVSKVVQYFKEFVEKQDFDEIKKEAAEMIKNHPRGEYACKEVLEFYLQDKN